MKHGKIHKHLVSQRKAENHRLISANAGRQKRKGGGLEIPVENIPLSRIKEESEIISSYYYGEEEFEW